MGEASRTELNQQTARVLSRVAAGERITITDRGRPIAEVAQPSTSPWDDLAAAGRVTRPVARGALPFTPIESAISSREILDDVRADRS